MTKLTSQQVVTALSRMIAACALESEWDGEAPASMQAEGERYRAALEAALAAYKSEHLRRWLYDRGVFITCGPSTCFGIGWRNIAAADLPLLNAVVSTARDRQQGKQRTWSTPEEAAVAIATALGYPRLEDEPNG